MLRDNKEYKNLRRNIMHELNVAKMKMVRYVDEQRVLGFWNVGQMIDTYLLDAEHKTVKGERLFQLLEDDTKISKRNLYQSVKLYNLYPKLEARPLLTWTHYTVLITIKQKEERERWEKKIFKESINSTAFKSLMREQRLLERQSQCMDLPRDLLEDVRGQIYTYRVAKVNFMQSHNSPHMLDCGFDIHIDQANGEAFNFKQLGVVRAAKNTNQFALTLTSKVKIDQLYTYKALVERVVDGDTIIVAIDCGFGIWSRQRLRLKGIDTPELTTVTGKRAKRFVEEKLKNLPFIIVKTYGTGKYDRYLVDIYYSPKENDPQSVASHGSFLNQDLLDAYLATKWRF